MEYIKLILESFAYWIVLFALLTVVLNNIFGVKSFSHTFSTFPKKKDVMAFILLIISDAFVLLSFIDFTKTFFLKYNQPAEIGVIIGSFFAFCTVAMAGVFILEIVREKRREEIKEEIKITEKESDKTKVKQTTVNSNLKEIDEKNERLKKKREDLMRRRERLKKKNLIKNN